MKQALRIEISYDTEYDSPGAQKKLAREIVNVITASCPKRGRGTVIDGEWQFRYNDITLTFGEDETEHLMSSPANAERINEAIDRAKGGRQ